MGKLKSLKSVMLLILMLILTIAISCAHYSNASRPESENIINAPIDVVWKKTLEILPTERMTLKEANKYLYFIQAKKHITFWSIGDNVTIKLIPKGEKQTLMIFDSTSIFSWGDWGHQGRMARNIFEQIRKVSEGVLPDENR